jgi:TRAP transporter 4TM/12TM fusion protein
MHAALDKGGAYLCRISALIYCLYLLRQFTHPDPPLLALPVHVFFSIGIVFLLKPLSPPHFSDAARAACRVFDLAAYFCCLYITWHYLSDTYRVQTRMDNVDPVLFGDYFAFCVGVPLMLEAVRRCAGMGLVAVLLVFLAYGFGGAYMPGWFHFNPFSLSAFTEITVLGTNGLFGVTASAILNFVFYFVLFGVVFSATGGGKIFIDLALRVTGHLVGGPAKTAIVASALFGTVSGSALANVTSTGVLTIPLMKRAGYTPEQAAATEAIASTGGQLMPPIMGVAAFVMADILGMPYSTVALAGIIPALGFYFALYLNVDLLARKTRLGMSQNGIPPSDPVLPRLHLLAAPILLVATLVMGYSAPMAALVGTLAAAVAPLLRSHTRYSPLKLFSFLVDAGKQVADVAVPVTAVGIVIVVAIQSGLAIKFVGLLAQLGEGHLLLSLLLVILGCIILGMGLPTVAAYIIGAVMFVPALSKLGVDKLAAHFFVMYYSVLSMVTPPVALAAFAAAAIAKANPYKTGWTGVGLGLAIFVMPFAFVNDQALLWRGSALHIAPACFGILCGTSAWAIALQGWLGGHLRMPIRALFALCCFAIVWEPTLSVIWTACVAIWLALTGAAFWKPASRFIHLPDATAES